MNPKSTSEHEGYESIRLIMNNLPVIFYVIDKNGIFKLSDGKGLVKLGLTPNQVVGMSAYEIYKDFPEIIESLDIALSGKPYMYEHHLGNFYLRNYLTPIFDYTGQVDGLVGLAIDISEQVEIEENLKSTNRLKDALIESLPGLLYMYNDQGQLEFWNKNHETMTGYNSEELYHMSLMDWYKDDSDSQAAVVAGLKATAETGFGDASTRLQCKDGSILPVYVTAAPLKIDDKNYFVGVGIDISTQKKAEEKLLELNQTLDQKVQERTNELSSMNEELVASNAELINLNEQMRLLNEELIESNKKLKEMQAYLVESEKMAALGSLVAGVAHEVNTPLGIGITAASHLSDISSKLISDYDKNFLQKDTLEKYLKDLSTASVIIEKNLSRAADLVKSFKQLSIDQSSEEKRRFDLTTYLDEILLSLSPTFKKSPVDIHNHYDYDIYIEGWPGAIAQIITNLTMNALHHAFKEDRPGHIDIYLSKEDDQVKIIFKDDGIGIDEKSVSQIFNPFFTTSRSTGRTGLGLSVVYSLVTQKFGGHITCESSINEGTTFYMTFNQNVD